MRAWAFALLFAAVVASCGRDDPPPPEPLTGLGFADKATAAIITGSELRAQPLRGPGVAVSSDTNLNTFTLPLEEEYADYKADPARLDELLSGIVEEAESTMEKGNAGTSFGDARTHIFPILKRVTTFRGLDEEPATTSFPGDLVVAYLVEGRSSLLAVTAEDLQRWDRSPEEIHELAEANLLRETNRNEPLRCEEDLCGWAAGDGWDAARLTVPELRRQIVEEIGPAVYAVPLDSVFVALPIKLANRIRPRVEHDFVTGTNSLSRELFVERDGELVVLRQ